MPSAVGVPNVLPGVGLGSASSAGPQSWVSPRTMKMFAASLVALLAFGGYTVLNQKGSNAAPTSASAASGQLSLRDTCNKISSVGSPYAPADQVKEAQYEIDNLGSVHSSDSGAEAALQSLVAADHAIVAAGSDADLESAFNQAADANNSIAAVCG
jgi:predicted membrane-bound mannosyltransferase